MNICSILLRRFCLYSLLLSAGIFHAFADEMDQPNEEQVGRYVKTWLPTHLKFNTLSIQSRMVSGKTLTIEAKLTTSVLEHLYQDVSQEIPELANASSGRGGAPAIVRKEHHAGEILEIPIDVEFKNTGGEWQYQKVEDSQKIEKLGKPISTFRFGTAELGTPEAKRLIANLQKSGKDGGGGESSKATDSKDDEKVSLEPKQSSVTRSNLKRSKQEESEFKNKLSKATVTIEAGPGRGSGFIYSHNGGYWLVSNTHVFGGTHDMGKLRMYDINSKSIPVTGEFACNLFADVAMLKINSDYTPPGFLVEAPEVLIGEKVFVSGNPQGAGTITLIEGEATGLGSLHGVGILESTAKFVPGCSGGPMVNWNGDLVGIVTYAMVPVKSEKDALLRDSSFNKARRMAVRAPELAKTKSSDFKEMFLAHKASDERLQILRFYASLEQSKNPSEILEVVAAYLASEDKPVMEYSLNGIRTSGMLNDYFTALEGLTKIGKALGEVKAQLQSKKKTKRTSIDPSEIARMEQDFLNKLKTKLPSTFIQEDMNNAIDEFISQKLAALAQSIK